MIFIGPHGAAHRKGNDMNNETEITMTFTVAQMKLINIALECRANDLDDRGRYEAAKQYDTLQTAVAVALETTVNG